MSDTTIRVSRSTHDRIKALAARSQESITAVVDAAIRALEEQRFWDDFDASIRALQANPGEWAEYRREFAAWEQATIGDGLAPEDESGDADGR